MNPAAGSNIRSFVAIGDSFTEGVGDELPDGSVRGWADLVAIGLARHTAPEPFRYANLAIRGRKLAPIVAEQVDAAVALNADLVSINGGGNDIIRPRIDMTAVARQLRDAVDRLAASGAHVLLLSGGDPSEHLPLGRLVRTRGEELTRRLLADPLPDGVTMVDNFGDAGLRDIRYWSADLLHLGPAGHARVASNVLRALDVPVPPEWGVDEVAAAAPGAPARRTAAYYREHVMPWVGRRLTGRSSGDGREPKRATLEPVALD
ncbi:lysophospholipase L1-like esterase [Diaminobutyricimonas aerilata]|uniref:Lysophospholipase L1-like esterase n=1 Tax=Diaminobutyricimonas aerilata TaxID=1162967 RepID=A0A2M9CFK5_9MICO|nr:SGNH/GDSL hydrolase family protein [Diaminobutyricimonas aerilata]PJJ70630.1 lysophospholipase L1-like esterase [Diaminobutyricimonas aerilata]